MKKLILLLFIPLLLQAAEKPVIKKPQRAQKKNKKKKSPAESKKASEETAKKPKYFILRFEGKDEYENKLFDQLLETIKPESKYSGISIGLTGQPISSNSIYSGQVPRLILINLKDVLASSPLKSDIKVNSNIYVPNRYKNQILKTVFIDTPSMPDLARKNVYIKFQTKFSVTGNMIYIVSFCLKENNLALCSEGKLATTFMEKLRKKRIAIENSLKKNLDQLPPELRNIIADYLYEKQSKKIV